MAFGLGTGTTLFDKSRYRAHGTITGADWATGAHGYALDFDSSVPDYVEIPASYDHLDFTSEDFSLIVRIKLDDLSTAPYFFTRGRRDIDGYGSYVAANGRIIFETIQSGAAQETRSSVGDITTAWHTIGISRDGASAKLYNNGVEVTYTLAGTHIDPDTSARAAMLGIHDNKASQPFDGLMEFLAVFGVALAASEQLAWHNALA